MITLLLVGLGKFYFTLTFEWAEQQPAYPTEKQYVMVRGLEITRGYLYHMGLDYDGMLSRGLKKLHGKYYQQALEQIPREDAERVNWLYMYDIVPQVMARRPQDLPLLIAKQRSALDVLRHHHSKNKWFEEIGRYDTLDNAVNFIFNNLSAAQLTYSEKDRLVHTLVSDTITSLQTVDISKQVNNGDQSESVISLSTAHRAMWGLMEFMKRDRKDICASDQDIESLGILARFIAHTLPQYDGKILTPWTRKHINQFRETEGQLNELDTGLQQKCGKGLNL